MTTSYAVPAKQPSYDRRFTWRRHHAHSAAFILLLTSLSMLGGTARAQSAGSLLISTGYMDIAPQTKTGPMQSTINTPRGTMNRTDGAISAQVANASTIGLTASYFITDNIVAEMVGGIPPVFNINGAGSAQQYGKLGNARMWSPTVLMKYYFGSATTKLRPFVGIGATYIWFTGAKITNTAFINDRLGGNTDVSVSKGFAPVLNAGLSYNIKKNWYVGMSVSYIPVSRDITLTTAKSTKAGGGSVRSTIRTQLNPIVTYFNVAYRF